MLGISLMLMGLFLLEKNMSIDSEKSLEQIYLSFNKILTKLEQLNKKTSSGKEITPKVLRKALNIMQKYHANCRWIFKMQNKNCVLAEGVNWLVSVYFQNDYNLIDADIKFFIEIIKQYEQYLKLPTKELWQEDMCINELEKYFNRAHKTIRNNIYKMNKLTNKKFVYLKDNTLMISKNGIEWLSKNCFKQKYLELLEQYKMELTELFMEKGYAYDNF